MTFKSEFVPISRAKHSHVLLSLTFTDTASCVRQHDPNSPSLLIEHKLDKVFLRACVSSPQTHKNEEDKTSAARNRGVRFKRNEDKAYPPFIFLKRILIFEGNEEENKIFKKEKRFDEEGKSGLFFVKRINNFSQSLLQTVFQTQIAKVMKIQVVFAQGYNL